MYDFSVLTTIDLKRRPLQLIKRAIYFCRITAKFDRVNVIISHANRHKLVDKIFIFICARFLHVIIASIDINDNFICNSKLRNNGYKYIKTKYMIICDIDIYPDIELFIYMYDQCKKERLSMIPCLYLTKHGTRRFFYEKKYQKIIDDWLSWYFIDVNHIAIPSSLICINTIDYKEIGGFDEIYTGHGYEDFDFLTRMAVYLNKINIESDFFIDKTYVAPLFAQGFRGELAKLCLENLLKKKIAIHLFHKKVKDDYYKSRINNANIFINKIKALFIFEKKLPLKKYPLLEKCYELCLKNGNDFSEFSILLKNIHHKKIINKNS
ncbi:galactosyltransferase-related protein [Bilophila wadsworthia]|uniref:galactosyltransferase-related protein n=1 Tax=Bilophila wadsworthia TaxID=35833 RepID=UPI0026DD34C3|nr:galactosyltransferase-related protein [Bilophila wadsworthia]